MPNPSANVPIQPSYPQPPTRNPTQMGSVDDNTSGACYAYRASKSALNIITASMAVDLQPEGVTCTLLHPG